MGHGKNSGNFNGEDMIKIIHIADVHIRNLMYHDVYKDIFNQLYSLLDKEQPDFVVIAGDVAHTKTNISPEFVEMASKFFKEIAKRSRLLITLGNHDLNLKATSRQDALTPIVDALDDENIVLIKHTNEWELYGYNVAFHILSELDKENWGPPSHPDMLNVAIYHGTINGSKVDSGFSLDHGDPPSVLYGHDYALLGDIHKAQQVLKQGWEEKYIDEAELQNYLNQGWEIDE